MPCGSVARSFRYRSLPNEIPTDRPYSDPEKAARRLMEHAQAFEPIQEGRIYIENGPFLFGDKGTPAEYSVGQSWRSRVAGSNCTRAARSSRKAAPSFAPDAICVPELTSTANIKLNARVSLRPT